ncbi:hypothetical protein DSECCO2_373010 [anaerobic digester metagenome]
MKKIVFSTLLLLGMVVASSAQSTYTIGRLQKYEIRINVQSGDLEIALWCSPPFDELCTTRPTKSSPIVKSGDLLYNLLESHKDYEVRMTYNGKEMRQYKIILKREEKFVKRDKFLKRENL